MKKHISIILALILAFSICLPVSAAAKPANASLPESGQLDFSKSDAKKGSYKYEFITIDHVEYCRKVFEDGYSTAFTVGVLFDTLDYAKTATEINIVDQIDGIPVTEAGIEYCKNSTDMPIYDCYNTKISDNTEDLSKRYICYNSYDSDNGKIEKQIGANVEKINIPDSIRFIPAETFAYMKKLKTVSLPKNLEVLGQAAFLNCTALESVAFTGNKVTKILFNTFKNCKALETVRFGKNKINYIGSYAFSGCKSLKKINLPSSLAYIGGCAFEKSGLEEVTIPKNASSSLNYDEDEMGSTFKNCKALKTVTYLGKDVVIPTGAFRGCDKLEKINLKNATSVKVMPGNTVSTKSDVLKISAKNKNVAKELACLLAKNNSGNCKKIKIYVNGELKYTLPCAKHSYKNVKAKEPTYFSVGHTAYKVCTICGKKSGYKEISKLTLASPKISVVSGKGRVKVKYTAVKDATGFQLKYSNSKGKTVTKSFSTEDSMTITLKNLSAGNRKIYARAFVTSGKRTAYSKWTAKTVTIK